MGGEVGISSRKPRIKRKKKEEKTKNKLCNSYKRTYEYIGRMESSKFSYNSYIFI